MIGGGLRSAWIDGIALWAPRLPGWDEAAAILRGEQGPPAEPARRPSPALLPPTERRRAPDTVAVSMEVAARACEAAGVGPAQTASVFASTHGDLAISDYMCETLAKTPTLTSPTKFHNSVHNAAAGYWTIATGCYEPYTAVSAFHHTYGQGLLEALAQAETSGAPVLYVAYDIEARGPMATVVPSRGMLGAALVISPAPSARAQAALAWEVAASPAPASRARPASLALAAGNDMAPCLPLYEALAAGEGTVGLSLGTGLLLRLGVSRVEA
jgi:hypothetical protein